MKYQKLLVSGLFLSLIGCTANKDNLSKLSSVGNIKYKYWDVIYTTNIFGRYHSPLNRDGKPYSCDKFEINGKVSHYDYLDSVSVIDRGCNTDIKYNPDDFIFESDTILSFGGRKFKIDALTKNIMVLKSISSDKNYMTVIYQASRMQEKEVVKCK